jgi:hypothetical protein
MMRREGYFERSKRTSTRGHQSTVADQDASGRVEMRQRNTPDFTPSSDPDLAIVVDSWERLPAAIKAGVVAMIRAAVSKEV